MNTTNATTPAAANGTSTTSVVNQSAQLGKDDFLKLLVAQLQHQDPTNPMDSKDFMGQLAQFSTLEQTTNMVQSISRLAVASSVTQAVDLIGRNVTFDRPDGSIGSGTALGVSIADGAVQIDVGGESVAPSAITSVGGASSGAQSTSTS